MNNLHPYCSNKNCHLPNPEVLNRLKKASKLTWQQLTDIFEVSERTIRRHARQSDKERQRVKQKRGRKLKIDGSNLDFLRDYVTKVNIPSLTNQNYLAKLFGCSQSTICTSIKRARVVYKGYTYHSIEQLRKKNLEKINHFINITLPYLLAIKANIFFLDETGFLLNLVSRKGYGLIGLPNIKQKLGNRGKNHTLMFLAQITNGEKLIHWRLIEGGMKTKDFHKFLSEFNPPNNGKPNYLIMDNLPTHKATKSCMKLKLSTIKELMTSKNTEIIFLPSYTPELNPIERVNGILKGDVRKEEARTKERLFSVIEERVKFFQKEDLTTYLDSSLKECLTKLNATTLIENKKYMWNEEQWDMMLETINQVVMNYNC